MKKLIFVFVTVLFLKPLLSVSQDTRIGLKTGLNVSIFTASINSESAFKSGFHLGAFVRTPISKIFSFRPEFYFSSQGQKDNYINNSGSTTTTVNYFNVPVLFELGKKVAFQFGPQAGFLLSGHEKGTINNQSVNDDLKDIMRKTEVGFVLGITAYPGSNVNIGARMQRGLSNIFTEPAGAGSSYPKIQNLVFQFYVGILFNSKNQTEPAK